MTDMPPLADRLRPNNLSDYIGQKHIIAEDKLLFKSIKNGQLFSMIFWGPPGVGKTTLARIIANEVDANFLEFSAVTTSIVDLKRIFEEIKESYFRRASENQQLLFEQSETTSRTTKSDTSPLESKSNKRTIIFIDEIHRFNKAQQDAFLPYVENGTITLIGATTENPSFEIIAPLLSRSRVFVLESLAPDDLEQVIKRGSKELGIKLEKDAKEFLKEITGGDARMLLNTLEIAALSKDFETQNKKTKNQEPKTKILTKQDIEQAIQKKALMYDKAGEEHYNTISAFIKSMRASNVDAALYYLARMIDAGEDPKFIARRMVIFASEDIGMAQPTALVVANEVFRAVETIGYPEAQINLAHGVAYLASAKKDRSAYNAYFAALADVKTYGNLPIPLELRNAPTKLMKEIGYGKDYEMYSQKSLLPEKIKDKKYFK